MRVRLWRCKGFQTGKKLHRSNIYGLTTERKDPGEEQTDGSSMYGSRESIHMTIKVCRDKLWCVLDEYGVKGKLMRAIRS